MAKCHRVSHRGRTAQAQGRAGREYPGSALGRVTLSWAAPSDRFDQHGAALAAADALGGDAAFQAEPLHGVDEMQDDAIAAGANRVAGADGAAVDIEPRAVDRSEERRVGKGCRARG